MKPGIWQSWRKAPWWIFLAGLALWFPLCRAAFALEHCDFQFDIPDTTLDTETTVTLRAVPGNPLDPPVDQLCFYVISETPERPLGCVLRENFTTCTCKSNGQPLADCGVLDYGPEPPGRYVVVVRAWKGALVSPNSNTRGFVWLAPQIPPPAPVLYADSDPIIEPPPDPGPDPGPDPDLVLSWQAGDPPALGGIDVPGSALTITARVNATAYTDPWKDNRVVSKTTSAAEQAHWWMLSTIAQGTDARLRFRLKVYGTTTTLIASSGNVPLNTWTRVAAVYDGAAMILYQNGLEVGRVAKSGPLSTDPNVLAHVGNNPPGAGSIPWQGQIDDLRIYRRALAPGELP